VPIIPGYETTKTHIKDLPFELLVVGDWCYTNILQRAFCVVQVVFGFTESAAALPTPHLTFLVAL
jgi:hypothetical protein